jgi:hypothetical protein
LHHPFIGSTRTVPIPQHGITLKPRRSSKEGAYCGAFKITELFNGGPSDKTNFSKTPSSNTISEKTHDGKMAPSDKTPGEAIDAISASQFATDSMVTLLVGKDEQKMVAYGSYLAQDSEFFAAALKKEWVEGQTRIIKLPEECPLTMAHYLSFVYSGKLFAEEITTVGGEQIRLCYYLLATLYVCGERFLNRGLQFAIVQHILRLTKILGKDGSYWYPNCKAVDIIYSGTPSSSPGRSLMVDLYVVKGAEEWLDAELGTEFVTDLLKAFYGKVQSLPFREEEMTAKKYMHPL